MPKSPILLSTVIVLVLGGSAAPVEAGKIFWAKPIDLADFTTYFFRADLDGSNEELVFTFEGQVQDFALDPAGDRLFFTLLGQGILRADPTNCTLVIPWSDPGGIAVDSTGGKLYWTDVAEGALYRADTEGSNIEPLVAGLSTPGQLALDPLDGKVYWAEDFRLGRADLDGSNVETVSATQARQVAVDPQGGKVYWLQQNPPLLRRADLDGADVEDLFAFSEATSMLGIDLDPPAGKLYWSYQAVDEFPEIDRADLDGTSREAVLVFEDFTLPAWIAIDPVGDGVSSVSCGSPPVPASARGTTAGLIVALLVASGFVLRRSGRTSRHAAQ